MSMISLFFIPQFALYGAYIIPFFMFQEGYPLKFWSYVGAPQPFIFFYLFYRFYKSSYTSKKKPPHPEILLNNNNNEEAPLTKKEL